MAYVMLLEGLNVKATATHKIEWALANVFFDHSQRSTTVIPRCKTLIWLDKIVQEMRYYFLLTGGGLRRTNIEIFVNLYTVGIDDSAIIFFGRL